MPIRRESVSLAAVCAVFVLLSIAGLAAAVLTRLITNIDGLLLTAICLMIGGLFALALFSVAQDMGLLPKHRGNTSQGGRAKTGEGK
jgi:drug/metabolite transporter (DMT)-like permease